MRLQPNAWCSGYSAISVMAVVQFGLAMMPLCCFTSAALISGTTSGTVVVHAERARVVHHHAAGLGRDGRELLRDAAAGAEQRDVDALERILGQFLHRDVLRRLNFSFLPTERAEASKRQLAHREIALLQRLDHLDADGARRTDHCHMRIAIHKRVQNIRPVRWRVNGCVNAGGSVSRWRLPESARALAEMRMVYDLAPASWSAAVLRRFS